MCVSGGTNEATLLGVGFKGEGKVGTLRFPAHVTVTPMLACFSISSNLYPKKETESTKTKNDGGGAAL